MEALRRGERLVSNEKSCVRFRQIWDQMSLSEEGCLFRKFILRGLSVVVPIIPVDLRLKFLEDCHGSAHMGVQRTYDLLRVNAYWPGMEADVEKFVTTCDRCQLHKPLTNLNKAPMKPIFSSNPMEVWVMDVIGPLPLTASGNRYILVATDLFSKWTEAVPLPCQTAVAVAHAFVGSVVLRHGTPKSLLTDQGSNFESLLMREICQLFGVNKIRTSPFHPRTDGQTERANRTHLATSRLSSDHTEDLRRNIELSVQRARKNNNEAKERFAKRYNERNNSDRWKPFSPGDKVKYVNQ